MDLQRKILTVETRRLEVANVIKGEYYWKFIDFDGRVRLPLNLDGWYTLMVQEIEPDGSKYITFYGKVRNQDMLDWGWRMVYPRTKTR